jgi:hypothetical protein
MKGEDGAAPESLGQAGANERAPVAAFVRNVHALRAIEDPVDNSA